MFIVGATTSCKHMTTFTRLLGGSTVTSGLLDLHDDDRTGKCRWIAAIHTTLTPSRTRSVTLIRTSLAIS